MVASTWARGFVPGCATCKRGVFKGTKSQRDWLCVYDCEYRTTYGGLPVVEMDGRVIQSFLGKIWRLTNLVKYLASTNLSVLFLD
jgi:hypothetical protein